MFDLTDTKSFMDNVHGYIRIPKIFIKYIIDTPEFQRLRNIDQTGMKILYPSAKHDRFSHSLGVYHLGLVAVDALLSNFQANPHWKIRSDRTRDVFWAKNKVLFLIACLLHDIAHAPFSHSLEQFYGFELRNSRDNLLRQLVGINDDTLYGTDAEAFDNASQHEKMSAYLLLKEDSIWRDRIKSILDSLNAVSYPAYSAESDGEYDNSPPSIDSSELDDDIRFIARMILGVRYSGFSPERQVRNCFVELLNGSFDVDKLDYTVRDTKMSGISNISLDIERLLGSLIIIPKTVYADCDVSVDTAGKSEILTELCLLPDKELKICGELNKGTNLKKAICLSNSRVRFGAGTKIELHPRNERTTHGVNSTGGAVTKDSVIFTNHSLLPSGGYDKTTISTLTDVPLDLHDTTTADDGFTIDLLSEPYDLWFSTDASPVTITPNQPIDITGVSLKGSLCGHVKRLEILSDKLSPSETRPTEHCFNGFSLGFKKQAVNLISNVADARNYLYLWIYSHHKVVYYANYLIVELARLSLPAVSAKRTLSDEMIQVITDNNESFLLDEDFILSRIRNAVRNGGCASYNMLFSELSSRVYKSSLYKSVPEFDLVFEGLDSYQKRKMRDYIEEISTVTSDEDIQARVPAGPLSLKYGTFDLSVFDGQDCGAMKISSLLREMIWVASNPSLKRPDPSSIYIKFGSEGESAVTSMDRLPILKMDSSSSAQKYYFYVYYSPLDSHTLSQYGIDADTDEGMEKLKNTVRNVFVNYMKSKPWESAR